MSIDWTSPVLVWPDTLLPVDRPASTPGTKNASPTAHSTNTAQSPPPRTPPTVVENETKQPAKRKKETLGSHDQMMWSNEIIDLTIDDDEPGPSTLCNPHASSSKKEKRSPRKRSSSRIEIYDLSPSPQLLPSVSHSLVQSAMDTQGQLSSSRSQADSSMRVPSPFHLSPPAHQSSYAPKRVSSKVIVVEDDDEEDNDNKPLVEVVKAKAKAKAKGYDKAKERVPPNLMQMTKPHRIPSPQPFSSHQQSVNRSRTTLLSPSLYPVNLPVFDHPPPTPANKPLPRPPSHPSLPSHGNSSSAPVSAPNKPTSKLRPDQPGPDTLIPPMVFLSPAPNRDPDNEGMDEEDGLSNEMSEQVDELEDDSGLEVERTVPRGITLTSLLLGSADASSDHGSERIAGQRAAAKQSRKECQDPNGGPLVSRGRGTSDCMVDADIAEVEEIVMGYVESDEEEFDMGMNLDNDTGPVVGGRVDGADGVEKVDMTATRMQERKVERVRMEGLALQFLKQ